MAHPERETEEFRKRWPIEHPDCFVGPLGVFESPAGFYIGRMCLDKEMGFVEPYSRESDYYSTRERAEAELKTMDFDVRDCVENNAAYAHGDLPRPGSS